MIHNAAAAGTIIAVRAGVLVACVGDATITIDVHKNGVSILTSTFNITSSYSPYDDPLEGTISSGTVAAGDIIEVEITVNAGSGTLGKGVFVSADIVENYA